MPGTIYSLQYPRLLQNNAELAHYIVGNHYQWNALAAGTGEAATEEQATGSICPKGVEVARIQ